MVPTPANVSCFPHFQEGHILFMAVVQEGDLSVVELLVSFGAQVNSQDNVSH